MKQELLNDLFDHASTAFQKLNPHLGHPRSVAKLESNPRDAALVKAKPKDQDSKRFFVRVTSFRSHLLDQDNLCEKYHVDCLRYAGIISDDDPRKTQIEVCQVKTLKGEDEFTRVEVFLLNSQLSTINSQPPQ